MFKKSQDATQSKMADVMHELHHLTCHRPVKAKKVEVYYRIHKTAIRADFSAHWDYLKSTNASLPDTTEEHLKYFNTFRSQCLKAESSHVHTEIECIVDEEHKAAVKEWKDCQKWSGNPADYTW